MFAVVEFEKIHDDQDREDIRFYIQHLDLHWRSEYEKKRPKNTGNKGPQNKSGPPRINRSKGRGR